MIDPRLGFNLFGVISFIPNHLAQSTGGKGKA